MAEKKYKGRKAYLNDFKKNAQGTYEYQGNLYRWNVSKEERLKELVILWIFCAGMLGALLATVCLDAPGTLNCVYVLLPAAISFIFGISVVWGMWKFTFSKNPIREYIYKATIEALMLRTVYAAILAVAAALGEMIYLVLHGAGDKVFGAVVFLLSEGIALLFTMVIRKKIRDIDEKIDKMSNEN